MGTYIMALGVLGPKMALGVFLEGSTATSYHIGSRIKILRPFDYYYSQALYQLS